MREKEWMRLTLQILLRTGWLLYLLTVLSSGWEQFASEKIQQALSSPQGGQVTLWLWAFAVLTTGFFVPVLMILVALFALDEKHSKPRLWSYLKNYFSQTLIETLRAWGKILLGYLFFIFPGIWLHIRYSFIPFVVTQDEAYNKGSVDALKRSGLLVHVRLKSVLFLLALFYVAIPLLLLALSDDYRDFFERPIASLAWSLLDTLIFALFMTLFYDQYLKTKGEITT